MDQYAVRSMLLQMMQLALHMAAFDFAADIGTSSLESCTQVDVVACRSHCCLADSLQGACGLHLQTAHSGTGHLRNFKGSF